MLDTIGRLQKEELITLEDAAVVVRPQKGKPKVKQAQSLVGAGALGGAFWGMLIGLLFFAPWLGLVAGAVGGAIFIKEVGETIEPGHSALFLLVVKATRDKVLPELAKYNATILQTSLSEEDDAKLREAFGAQDVE
ncbi:MAG: hypothetical protein AMJ56_06860 [Anaerolineae bacterium SG8_19]|nr:MAG: hypothetical protein AMJ56_06860 [Anaerolineae bacterium SG8_19]